jgi:transposase
MNRLLKPLKKLPHLIKEFRNSLDKNKYDCINIYFQDESRFGLMTKQKRVLVSKGIKPIGKYQHSYKWLWLWGCFSPVTGDAFYWETSHVGNDIFEGFLNDFSRTNPRELKLLIIDNAGFHACQNITIPENIKLIRIPAYAPELNPAEKVWQWMKGKVAMKFFKSTKSLQNKITEMVDQLKPDLVKSITGYELYTKTFYEQISS